MGLEMYKVVNGAEVILSEQEIEDFKARELTHSEYLQSGEFATQQFNQLNADVLKKLEKIDLKSIRALRAKDDVKLLELEQQAVILRSQLLPAE